MHSVLTEISGLQDHRLDWPCGAVLGKDVGEMVRGGHSGYPGTDYADVRIRGQEVLAAVHRLRRDIGLSLPE